MSTETVFSNCAHVVLVILILVFASCGSQMKDTTSSQMEKRWTFDYRIAVTSPFVEPAFAEINGKPSVITSAEGSLRAFSVEDGEGVWESALDPRQELDCVDMMIKEDQIFCTHFFNVLASWRLADGKKLWEYSSTTDSNRKKFYPQIYLGADETTVFGSADGGWLQAISQETGKLIYEKQFESLPRGVTHEGGYIYISYGYVPEGGQGQAVGGIIKADAETGEPVWTYTTERGGFYRMRPIVRNGQVYAGTKTGDDVEFVALDAETGEPSWKTSGVRTYAATWADGKIIVNDRINLKALDPADGSVEWVADMNAGHGEAGIAYLDGYLYHPHGVAMRVVDVQTGEIVHVEPPSDGTYVWEVGAGAGTVVAQTSTKVIAYEPFEPVR